MPIRMKATMNGSFLTPIQLFKLGKVFTVVGTFIPLFFTFCHTLSDIGAALLINISINEQTEA